MKILELEIKSDLINFLSDRDNYLSFDDDLRLRYINSIDRIYNELSKRIDLNEYKEFESDEIEDLLLSLDRFI